MAHINLLPWREELRQERQQRFYSVLVTGFIFAGLVLYAVMVFADGLIQEQNSRNTFLEKEITEVDKKIKEIQTLEAEREKLLASMQIIQELQISRPKVVQVLDALVKVIPDGIHLETLKRQGNKLTLTGEAESNARVSVFMNKIDENLEFEEAELQVIQKTGAKADAEGTIKKFTLNANESKPKKEDEDN